MYDITDLGPRRRVISALDLVVIPLHRWRIVLVVTLIGLAAAAGYQWLVPASYTGTAVVVVRPVVTDPFAYPSSGADRAVNMNAESGIATGNEVVEQVAKAAGRSTAEVRERLAVETPVGGQVLRFSYRGSSVAEAVRAANAAATSYLQVRRSAYQTQRDALVKSYDDTIAALDGQRAGLVRSLPTNQSSVPTPGATAVLDQLRAFDDQLAQLSQQRAKVAAIDMTPGTVTRSAAPPLPSSHDGALLILLTGCLGGLLAGAIIAFARESTDRRLRSAAEAAEIAGVPVLGAVRRPSRRVPGSRAAADAAYVALALTETLAREGLRPLVLLSAGDNEERTSLVADLAVALARDGRAVYVVDAAGRGTELRNRIAQRRQPASAGSAAVPPAAPVAVAAPRAAEPAVGLRAAARPPRGRSPSSRDRYWSGRRTRPRRVWWCWSTRRLRTPTRAACGLPGTRRRCWSSPATGPGSPSCGAWWSGSPAPVPSRSGSC
jgi:capsular polysaccharide biosynthesis protein